MKAVNPQESKIMVFAGAGASAGLGFPTTPQFIDMLGQKWSNFRNILKLCQKYIRDTSETTGNIQVDSEVFRDWLIALRDRAEDIKILSENQQFETKIGTLSNAPVLVDKFLFEFDNIVRSTYKDICRVSS